MKTPILTILIVLYFMNLVDSEFNDFTLEENQDRYKKIDMDSIVINNANTNNLMNSSFTSDYIDLVAMLREVNSIH